MSRSRRFLWSLAIMASLVIGVAAGLTYSGRAVAEPPERHPHIRRAIVELREARKELETAAHDFGGHRVQAVKAINGALAQLDKCLKHDRD